MAQDYEKELRLLEADYFNQPSYLRKKDLGIINALRAVLGLPPVDANLRPMATSFVVPLDAPPQKPKKIVDPHEEAKAWYSAYLQKQARLAPHREYCDNFIRATTPRNGQTPVVPFATWGTNDGPILCDTCNKEIPLEGAPYKGVPALAALTDAVSKGLTEADAASWYSWILGGVLVIKEVNGTLRVYHGYPGGSKCQNVAEGEMREQERAFRASGAGIVPHDFREKLGDFLFSARLAPRSGVAGFVELIKSEIFAFDPGIGVNRP